jgi:aspartyl aminopeptidase
MKNEILVKYLKAGITPFHLVQQCAADLEAAGFAPLAMEEAWHLEESKKYYINHHGTTILANGELLEAELILGHGIIR